MSVEHTHDERQRVADLERDNEMRNWFRFHPATPTTGPIHDQIRQGFRGLLEDLLPLLPKGPDRTLAVRKLQAAMMACNACVANAQTEDEPQVNPHSRGTPLP